MAAWLERRRIRRDEALLRQMPDYQLRDIGVQRTAGGRFVRMVPTRPDRWPEATSFGTQPVRPASRQRQ